MNVRKFAISDARFDRSPGQEGEAFVANVVDQKDASPITIGYGRYGPDQSMDEEIAVDEQEIVKRARLAVQLQRFPPTHRE